MQTNNLISNTYQSLKGYKLQHFYSIRIDNNGLVKKVFFLSSVHVNKETEVNFCFSHHFTDSEILQDQQLFNFISERFDTVISLF